jgi:hypothetical protein
MKTKISVLSIITISIFSFHSNAQNKFIEILATDSVELKPVSFVYQVSSGTEINVFSIKMDKQDNEPVLSLTNIKKLLDKNSFAYQAKGKGNYSIPEKTADSSVFVTLSSIEELNRLFKVLSNAKGISGKIAEVKYESISPYKADIYQRLYSKAFTDATTLAKVSNNTIGQLISVQEPAQTMDFFSGYQDMFQKLFSNNPIFSQMFGLESNLTQKTEKKLLFRFELK